MGTLSESRAFSGFAAPDLEKLKEFYGQTLGLDVTDDHGLLTLHLAGGKRNREESWWQPCKAR